MADKATIKKRLDQAVERLADIGPDVAEDWGVTILFTFSRETARSTGGTGASQ